MKVTNPQGVSYEVGKLLGRTSVYNLYVCTAPNGEECIFKIAVDNTQNGIIDREAYLLDTMFKRSAEMEKNHFNAHPGSKHKMNCQHFFPRVIDAFIFEEQGNRRVLILGFPEICSKIIELAPLEHLMTRENIRIDPKTSAWILGKLLKLLAFVHSMGMSLGQILGDNILINREKHHVAIFDWSKAKLSEPSSEQVASEISDVAEHVFLALGGNIEAAEIPDDSQLENGEYLHFLLRLIHGKQTDAQDVHKRFYDLLSRIWPEGGFHPFTAYAVN